MKRGLFISLILVIMLLLAGLVSMLYSANAVGEYLWLRAKWYSKRTRLW